MNLQEIDKMLEEEYPEYYNNKVDDYVELNINIEDILEYIKNESNCNLVICHDTEAGEIQKGKYEAYIVPYNGQGVNQIHSMTLYAEDYAECNDEEQYIDWLTSCFDTTIEVNKSEEENYNFKINIK